MLHHKRSTSPAGAASTSGLLLSLASALPAPDGAMGRAARHLAHRLSIGKPDCADIRAAGDLLARLLDETDTGCAGYDADLLDEEFDA